MIIIWNSLISSLFNYIFFIKCNTRIDRGISLVWPPLSYSPIWGCFAAVLISNVIIRVSLKSIWSWFEEVRNPLCAQVVCFSVQLLYLQKNKIKSDSFPYWLGLPSVSSYCCLLYVLLVAKRALLYLLLSHQEVLTSYNKVTVRSSFLRN